MPSTHPLRRRPLTLLLPLAATLAVAAAVAPAARALSQPAGTTALLSGAPDLIAPLKTPVASATSGAQAVDRTGRWVVFSSTADGLFDGDDDSVRNVYLKWIETGQIDLVSRDSDGQPSHSDCSEPAISANGVDIAFTCSGPLDPADTNGYSDVYLCRIGCGPGNGSQLLSRASGGGAVGDGPSHAPAISGTGEYVAFLSTARNLGAPPVGANAYRVATYADKGVVAVSIGDGQPTRASPTADDASTVSISADGLTVAFDTAKAFDPADRNGLRDVYARRIPQLRTLLVSRGDADGAAGNGTSFNPRIDEAGDVVAFDSTSTDFDRANDATTDVDVYRRGLNTGLTRLVSRTAGGPQNDAPARVAGLSADGALTAYRTAQRGLDPADTTPDGADLYVTGPGGTVLASRADGADGAPSNEAQAGSLSGDGQTAVATVGGGRGRVPSRVEARDLLSSRTRLASRPPGEGPFTNDGGNAAAGVLSANGRFAAFVTTAPAFGVAYASEGMVVVRDTRSGAVTVASRADGPDGAPLPGVPRDVQITPDGRYVVFTLGPDEDSLPSDDDSVYRRDLVEGRTALVSRADGPEGAPANENAFDATISDDGSRVAFVSSSTNLGDGGRIGAFDVHVRDLAAGRTLLVSRQSGLDPADAISGNAFEAAISGDGRSVGFSSFMRGLAPGDADEKEDVFVRQLDSGVTTLVGLADDGRKPDRDATFLAIDRDGDRIVLSSDASSFPVRDREAIYVRDLATSRLLLVSRGDGPDGAPADNRIGIARISADGERVAFEASSSGPLAPGAPTDEGRRVYLRELAAARTSLLSRASGPEGAVPEFAQLTGIEPGGGCVAFSAGPLAFGAAPSNDFTQQFARVIDDRCGALPDADDGGGQAPGGDDGGDGPDPGAGGGVSRAARDRTAPRVSAVRLSRGRIRRGGRTTALAARATARPATSTVLTFGTTEPGRLTVAVAQEAAGRRAARGRCVQAGERVRRARRCVALKPVATIKRTLRAAGAGRLRLTAKLGRRTLVPGSYRLTLVVRDAAGNASKPASVRLTVMR